MAAPSFPNGFPNDAYPPHLNAAVEAATRKALADASDPRAALPGPLRHNARCDITAVLMHMVDDDAISPPVARLVAWARGLNPSTNGAYYNRRCRPIIVWHGLYFDAQEFADLYREECAAADAVVDGLPMTGGLGARQRPVERLWVDDTLNWPPSFGQRLLRAAGDVLLWVGFCFLMAGLALALWQIGASLVTIWPWIGGGAW